jgi:hypothetical protein
MKEILFGIEKENGSFLRVIKHNGFYYVEKRELHGFLQKNKHRKLKDAKRDFEYLKLIFENHKE